MSAIKATMADRLTTRPRNALALLESERGRLSCDDARTDAFSGDGEPDTWNSLFRKDLAQQWCVGPSEDDHEIRITAAGRRALQERQP